MEKEIIWAPLAFEDLESIYNHISTDSKLYAVKFIDRILKKIEILKDQPRIGRVVPEKHDSSIREVFYGNYRIMYDISQLPSIIIYRIVHSAQFFNP